MTYRLFCLLMILVLAVSCSKEGQTVVLPDPAERQPDDAPIVVVVYDADGVGDLSYNDLIYQGVEDAARQHGLRTMQLSPHSKSEGLAYLETLFAQMSAASDGVRRLCIVASSVYDDFVRANNKRLEANDCAALLYLETDRKLEGKGSTLTLPFYGAMYEAGSMASLFASEIILVGANPVDEPVAGALKGFTAGFNDRQAYISEQHPADWEMWEGTLQTVYLKEKSGEGYDADDAEVLAMLKDNDIANEYTNLLVPVCGGAGNTFARLADVIGSYGLMGVDCVQNSVHSHLSVVKHIDRAVSRCIGQWLSAEGMPKHQVLGLSAGFTGVVLHPQNTEMKERVQQHLTDEERARIHREALRKEEAYAQ